MESILKAARFRAAHFFFSSPFPRTPWRAGRHQAGGREYGFHAAIAHIGLTGAAESETRSQALTVLRAALEHSAHVNQVQPGIGSDVGDPVLDLLYILTSLELLRKDRKAIDSAIERVWAEVPGSEPSQT